MRAVMFHQGALGDFLLALSAFEGWCEPRSGIGVDFWSKREHVSLLFGKEYLGGFHPLDGLLVPSLLNDHLWKTIPLPDFLLRSDQVFIFGHEGSRIIAERLSSRTGAKVDWLRSFPAPDEGCNHVLDFIHHQLAKLRPPCRRKSGLARITSPPLAIVAARECLGGLGFSGRSPGPVLVHPGSGSAKKVWPLGNWRNLLHWMKKELRVPVVLSCGPADECVEDFCRRMSAEDLPIISGLSLVELSAFLTLCRAYVGCDSGVSHLAAAVGTPSLVIFGPTDPGVWGPRAENVHILRRSWAEREVFDWSMKGAPEEPDREIAEKLRGLLAD